MRWAGQGAGLRPRLRPATGSSQAGAALVLRLHVPAQHRPSARWPPASAQLSSWSTPDADEWTSESPDPGSAAETNQHTDSQSYGVTLM